MKNKPVEMEQDLIESLNQIDKMIVPVPELSFFTKLINQQKLIKLRKQNYQFALFIASAIALLSLLFFFLFSYTIIIYVIEGLSFIASTLWIAFTLINRKERVG